MIKDVIAVKENSSREDIGGVFFYILWLCKNISEIATFTMEKICTLSQVSFPMIAKHTENILGCYSVIISIFNIIKPQKKCNRANLEV